MKTINKDIDVFYNIDSAFKAFEKSKVPAHLLKATVANKRVYYLDRSKTAKADWPKHYTILNEK